MNKITKVTILSTLFLANNLNANNFENLANSLKLALGSYSTYFFVNNFGREIVTSSFESIKNKKINTDLNYKVGLITPIFIGNYYLIKDVLNKQNNSKKIDNNKPITLNNSLKALFKTKNGYKSIAKALLAGGSVITTYLIAQEIVINEDDEMSNPERAELAVASLLPTAYGIYRLAQSSKDSFNKAYNEVV